MGGATRWGGGLLGGMGSYKVVGATRWLGLLGGWGY